MITATFAILLVAAGILAGCFTGKVSDRINDTALVKLTAASGAVFTTSLAYAIGGFHSALFFAILGVITIRYCIPITNWTEANSRKPESYELVQSWVTYGGLCGGIAGLLFAVASCLVGLPWKLALLPGEAITTVLLFGTLLWLSQSLQAAIVAGKKLLSTTFLSSLADRAASALSGRLS